MIRTPAETPATATQTIMAKIMAEAVVATGPAMAATIAVTTPPQETLVEPMVPHVITTLVISMLAILTKSLSMAATFSHYPRKVIAAISAPETPDSRAAGQTSTVSFVVSGTHIIGRNVRNMQEKPLVTSSATAEVTTVVLVTVIPTQAEQDKIDNQKPCHQKMILRAMRDQH